MVAANRTCVNPVSIGFMVNGEIGFLVTLNMVQDPFLHRLVVVFKDSRVSIEIVVPVWNDRRDGRPDCAP